MNARPLAALLAFAFTRIAIAQTDDTTKAMIDSMLNSAHTGADPVLGSLLVSDADKTKIKASLKDFEDFADKLKHPPAGAAAPDQAAMFTQIMDHMNAVNNYIADRPDLFFITTRSTLIDAFETNLLQGAGMQGGDSGKYLAIVKAAGIDDAATQKISARIDKFTADEKKLMATTMDQQQPAQARQDAANAMPALAATAQKEIRKFLSPDQNADLDWQIVLIGNALSLSDGLPIAYSTFLAPVKAPQDAKYTLKSGPKSGPFQSLTTVNLKKGDPIRFTTTGKSLQSTAGTNEVPIADPSPEVIFWQIDPPLKPAIEVVPSGSPLSPN